MKQLLIAFIFTISTLFTVQSFADASEWNEMKGLCQAGAINNQDRAHRPKINCTYSETGGFYKENTVETLKINRHIVEPTTKSFTATFSTDKSKSDRIFPVDEFIDGADRSKQPVVSEESKCINYSYSQKINFIYERPDTCQIMQDHPTPKTFCDHVYNNVLTKQERDTYTNKETLNTVECLSEKDGKF